MLTDILLQRCGVKFSELEQYQYIEEEQVQETEPLAVEDANQGIQNIEMMKPEAIQPKEQ